MGVRAAGAVRPTERTRAQWADSVDAEILYPTPELWDAIRQLPDAELKVALVRAYNDWIAGFCAESPDRLFGLAKLPTTSVEDARDELLRCVNELGLRGAILDAFPSGSPAGGNPADDPFWETVNDLMVPISFHYAFGAAADTAAALWHRPGDEAAHGRHAAAAWWRPASSTDIPEVKIVLAHGDAGWALHWMEFFDINYVRHKHLAEYALQDTEAVPSDYIRKHAWFTFHQDRPAVKNRHRLGGAHLMWGSHFPYEDSNWPDNRQQAMRVVDSTPADDRHVSACR